MTTTTDTRSAGDDMTDSTDLLSWALEYERRGWSLVALHAVEYVEGLAVCTCGNRDERHRSQAGKHPRDSGWQRNGTPAIWWQRGHGNIGIRTGRASGFWVLDYDPASATDVPDTGDVLYHRLISEGYAPHVRTGGGGFHYRFTLPDFEVRNRQSAGGGAGRTHALPMRWDVRGEGGQVVAPPSVTAKGAYVELEPGGAAVPRVHTSPAWLLELIRPQAVDKSVNGERPDHVVSPLPQVSVGRPEAEASVTGGAVEGSLRPADQVQAYCTAALYAEVEAYGSLHDGRRGEAAAAFARRLVELANLARWPLEGVYGHFEAAMHRAAGNAGGGGYADHEIPGQWARALEHVGDRAAVIPPRLEVLPPFLSAGPGSAQTGGEPALNLVDPSSGTGAGGVNGHGAIGGGSTPISTGGSMPGREQVFAAPPVWDPWQQAVAKRVQALDVDDAARAYRTARDAAGRPSLASRVLTGDTLDAVPDPVPLIDGWLFLDSTARINGRPGQGKSFVAADLLCSVATGTAWAGVPVRQGPVLAVVAEGVSGFKLRIRAWENERGVKVGAALHLVPEPVQTLDPAAWAELVAYAVTLRPALITLDTQARISVGARENDSTDMGRVVAAVEELRRATGACVLLVHHAVKSGEAEAGRGSNAVEGATTSEFFVSKNGHAVTVKTTRQKDIESEAKAVFDLKSVDKSAVLVHRLELADPGGHGEEWRGQAIRLYEVLRTGPVQGMTWAEIRKSAGEAAEFKGRHTNAIIHAWNNLVIRGIVIHSVNKSGNFGVHVRENHGPDGVLTPNVGEWSLDNPPGWTTYAEHLVATPDMDLSVNLGKQGRLTESKQRPANKK